MAQDEDEFVMVTHKGLARALNTWMHRYQSDPAAFAAEFNTVAQFRADVASGRKPTYGEEQASYLLKLIDEIGTGSFG